MVITFAFYSFKILENAINDFDLRSHNNSFIASFTVVLVRRVIIADQKSALVSGNAWNVDFLQRLDLSAVHYISSLTETVKYWSSCDLFPLVFFLPLHIFVLLKLS